MRRRPWLFAPLVLLAGCAHEEQAKKETAHPAVASAAPPGEAAAPSEKSCSSDTECGAKQLCIRSRCVDITPDLAECSAVRVHFGFNDSVITPDDVNHLQRISRCLKADTALHVTIEGNADERGTPEYNMALGDQRATAVRKYLQSIGVSDQQLRTVSYGKENPLCTEHDEECWAKNRSAQVKPAEQTPPPTRKKKS
jgi:peptidoglycan-associated lipoprotein